MGGAGFAALFGAGNGKGLSGPGIDIGHGRVGASWGHVDFAGTLMDEPHEQFLFDAVHGTSAGGEWCEGCGGGDHAAQQETVSQADCGGLWFFPLDGEDADFAGWLIGFVCEDESGTDGGKGDGDDRSCKA
jgi:hypothetical protein